jgi:hypothetical protein
MKKLIIPCLAAAFATASSFAAPADDIKAAAKKLADSANYSWSTNTQNAGAAAGGGGGGGGRGGFGGGPSSGKVEKGGYAIITRTTPNGESQTVRKGDQVVLQNQEGAWVTMEEMMAQFGGGRGGGGGGGAPGGGQGGNRGGGGGGGGRGGFGGGFGGGQNPADELVALIDVVKDLKSADGAISGGLTDEAVTQRLSFGGRGGRGGGGQAPAAPTNASGSVKFWLKDGMVTKYELTVKGTVQGRNGEQQIDRTTTTEIKDVGTTKVDVPEGAKKKFSA